ncbi:hypothetical protein ABE66_08075 [Cytobacillus firmus]|nr:hypothetical protein [Cytobacillus firmus]
MLSNYSYAKTKNYILKFTPSARRGFLKSSPYLPGFSPAGFGTVHSACCRSFIGPGPSASLDKNYSYVYE